MTSHTTSLKMAKRLKEAGYPQEGEFWWKHYEKNKVGQLPVLMPDEDINDSFMEDYYAAPLATELLERIPVRLYISKEKQPLAGNSILWHVSGQEGSGIPIFAEESLTDALAECWLYLKQEGLL